MSFPMRLDGLRGLESAMLELKTSAAKAVARRVLKRAAQPLADGMNARAPEAEGDLNTSYAVSGRLNRRQRQLARAGTRSDVEVHAGTNNPAGVQQEFGNRRHGAQPHVRPTWDAGKDDALADVIEGMQVEVEKSVARARRKAARAARG